MNAKLNKRVLFALTMVMVLVLSACGTLEIDSEPGASGAKDAASESEVPLATLAPTVEETYVIDEAILTPVEASHEVDREGEATQPSTAASEITKLDETWNQLTDYRLGFSIRFPNEMATFRGSCTWNEEQGSYRPKMALVPVKIFEDTDAVYIAAEQYYELAEERKDGGVSFYDECNLVTNSLELLRDPEGFKEPYWKLVVKEVGNDGELDTFIKARYGSGCSLGEQMLSLQDSVYDVEIQGDGKDMEETQCPLNFGTVIKYFPVGGKVIAWDTGQAYSFPADVNYSATYDQDMADSFRFLTDTSLEPGAEPLATVGYSDVETGISFSYPTSWAMEEEAHAFVFRNGSIILRVGYRMPGDTTDHGGRTGMGGTDIVVMEGLVPFLDQSLAKHGVWYFDDALIVVIYGGPPGTKVQSGDMEFTIILEDPDTDYETPTLTEEIQAEAEMILASFAVGSTQGGPVSGLGTYINSEYGFTLHYPSTWSVAEINDDEFVGPGSRSVQLSQGTVELVIGYRRSGEEVPIGGSGAPGGEFDVRGSVQMLGQDVDRYVIVYGGKDKVVMYGQPGPPPLSAGGLEFALRMDDFAQVNYEEIELAQSVQDEADMILSSLAIIEVDGVSNDLLASGWKTYSNEAWGYSLMVPGDAEIVSPDPNWRVAFIGPEINSKPQFQFVVEHYDIDLAETADFWQSLAEGQHAYLESIGREGEGQVEELVIAGEPAFRLRHFGSGGADQSRDDYFLLHGNTVFAISIEHIGGVEDEVLNDQFLQSITFSW